MRKPEEIDANREQFRSGSSPWLARISRPLVRRVALSRPRSARLGHAGARGGLRGRVARTCVTWIALAGVAGAIALGVVGGGGPGAAQAAGAGAPANGISNDPNYWPIGVWLQNPALHAAAFRAIHINLFIGLWQGPTKVQLAALASAKMSAFGAQNALALQSPDRGVIKAWMQVDEPDDAQTDGRASGNCISPTLIRQQYLEMKALDPTRPVYLNLGGASR